MSKELNENIGFRISIKTLLGIGAGMATIISMWFVLQSDIEEAKKLPKPPIERIEYDLKDELVRQTIMDRQDDVEAILKELEKIDKRLYELQKER
tara:strand:+ start:88 stop:372 length:285 start_codon:yes stop_codon:yes gene_type:complete